MHSQGKHEKLRKSLIYREESMVRPPPNRLFGRGVWRFAKRADSRGGSTDGNGSWKSSDATDRHTQTSRCGARRNTRDVEEAGGDRARGSRWQYCQASEERRAHPYWRTRHTPGSQARCTHWPQPGDRRGNSDQGERKGRLPRYERVERVDLTTSCRTLRGKRQARSNWLPPAVSFWTWHRHLHRAVVARYWATLMGG